MVVSIAAIKGDTVLLDGSHPLAKLELKFNINVLDVYETSLEEIAYQHVHGAHGHHH